MSGLFAPKLFRYFLTAGAASVVDVGGFALLCLTAHVPVAVSAVASFCVAAVVNYLLSSRLRVQRSAEPCGDSACSWWQPCGGLLVNVSVTLLGTSYLALAAGARQDHRRRDRISGQLLDQSSGGVPFISCRRASLGCEISLQDWMSALVCAVVGAVMFLVFGLLTLLRGHPEEDAYIMFRYADHVARGFGIVFNAAGPHAEGATDFLWMVMLSALDFIGIDVAVAAVILNALGAGLAAFLLAQVVSRSALPRGPRLIWLALGTVCVPFLSAAMAAYGCFSTMLYAAIALAAVDVSLRGAPRAVKWLPALALTLGLFRPDGVVIGAAVVLLGARRARSLGVFKPFLMVLAGAFVLGVQATSPGVTPTSGAAALAPLRQVEGGRHRQAGRTAGARADRGARHAGTGRQHPLAVHRRRAGSHTGGVAGFVPAVPGRPLVAGVAGPRERRVALCLAAGFADFCLPDPELLLEVPGAHPAGSRVFRDPGECQFVEAWPGQQWRRHGHGVAERAATAVCGRCIDQPSAGPGARVATLMSSPRAMAAH